MPVSPVFILGAPRSGTSVISAILRDELGYQGENEGHIWTLYQQLQAALDSHQRFIKESFPPRPVTTYQRITYERVSTDLLDTFKRYVDELYDGKPWCDKTPSPQLISFAPTLQTIFPGAAFIVMKRRGIENILSAQRKFRDRDFRLSCQIWNWCAEAFLEVQDRIERMLVLDQADLLATPAESMARMVAFLELADGDVERCTAYLNSHFPERTHIGAGEQLSLEATGWSEEQRRIFLEVCGHSMNDLGYKLEGTESFEVKNTNKWCQVSEDPFAKPTVIHPNPPGQPHPILRYRAVDFRGTSRLVLSAVANSEGPGANLTAALERNGTTAARTSVELAPGQPTEIDLEVPSEAPCWDIVISAHLPDSFSSHYGTGIRLAPFKRQ